MDGEIVTTECEVSSSFSNNGPISKTQVNPIGQERLQTKFESLFGEFDLKKSRIAARLLSVSCHNEMFDSFFYCNHVD